MLELDDDWVVHGGGLNPPDPPTDEVLEDEPIEHIAEADGPVQEEGDAYHF